MKNVVEGGKEGVEKMEVVDEVLCQVHGTEELYRDLRDGVGDGHAIVLAGAQGTYDVHVVLRKHLHEFPL